MVALQNEVNELTQQIIDQETKISRYQKMEVEFETIGPLRIHLENLESQVKEKSETIIKLQNSFD